MKKSLLLLAAVSAASLAGAQEMGRVISSTPIIEQVGVPRQVCSTEQVAVQQGNSGAGAVMGAIAGGAVGNTIGRGSGRAAATMLGLVGGAIVGNRIEGGPTAQLQNVQRCSTQTVFENQPVAYNVVYEYAGRQYRVQMPNDPGPMIALTVRPVGVSVPAPAPLHSTGYQQQPGLQPANVVVDAPLRANDERRFYRQPYPAPIANDDNWDERADDRYWR